MAKKALCIGINDYPGTDHDLSGCVNDANDWKTVLEQHDFVIEQLINKEATKDAMYQGIQRLVQEAESGDVVVITYSGHGSWIPDENGDESDRRDEVLCPYDISQNRPLTDDELYNIFAQRKQGTRIVMITDSCHSGTVSRSPETPRGTGPRIRFLPPAEFLPPSKVKAAERLEMFRAVDVRRPFGGVHLSGCRDIEYSYDAVFKGKANGAFTYFALKALKAVGSNATYEQWHKAIRKFLPNQTYPQTPELQGSREQKIWNVFEGEQFNQPKGGCMSKVVNSSTERSRSPWILDRSVGLRKPSGNRAIPNSSLQAGDYVIAIGQGDRLYRIQNGCRQSVNPSDIDSLGITQSDIKQANALELSSFPIESKQQRAIGRDIQKYLDSRFSGGHLIRSWVWLQGTTLTVRTQTEAYTWFNGWTGGVSVILYDVDGNRINYDTIHYRYGIDGRAFGSGFREDTETIQLPQSVADAVENIAIVHAPDPKTDFIKTFIQVFTFVGWLIDEIGKLQQQGEDVNAGAEDF